MMNKSKNSKAWRWKVATFLPLLALLLMAFGNRSETRIEKEIRNEISSITQSGLKDDIRSTNQDVVSDQLASNLVQNDQKKEETAISKKKQESQKVIKGKVIDELGNALEGVTVSGSKRMKTTTDANGNFEIAMTEDLPLCFSHAGLQSTVRTPPEFEESTIVKMEPEIINLGISIGMYTSKKTSTGVKSSPSNEVVETEDNGNTKIYTIVNQMPEFPGGTNALRQFIAKQTIYPKIAQEEKAHGEVLVNFVINREGRVWYAKVVKSVHPALDQEAIRVIYSMPQWKPGVNHGETVNVTYNIPITFLLKTSTTNADKLETTGKSANDAYTAVDEIPQFPGGNEALRVFVDTNMKYPIIALENGIFGQVTVNFIVDKTGKVLNVRLFSGVDPSLDKEAIRIVESMPKWIPGKQNGENVDVVYKLPINFQYPKDYHPVMREKLHIKQN